ncbi:syntaxin-1B-like [Calypte anna]|uniref:syntaxin-1B-like n=1 Tax=Calypte anna TaxID=9244 RepID=UPI0011C466A5|nr:syntaxin-1B-like [Calypte anna]
MRDRLPELRQRVAAEGDATEEPPSFDNAAFGGDHDDGGPVGRALREAAELWRVLEGLEQLSERIDRAQQTVLCCTSPDGIAREKRGLGAAKAAFTRQAVALQLRLVALPAPPEMGTSRAGPRVRQTQLWLLLRRYRTLLARHYARENRYRQRLMEQMERQLELAGVELRAEERERLAQSPGTLRIVGRDLEELKAEQQHMEAARARQQQLLELEMQMEELHGLFLRLEGLVGEHHGAADSVEQHVLRTLDYVAQTGGEVKKASKYQRPSRLSALLAAALGLCPCCSCLPCLGSALP